MKISNIWDCTVYVFPVYVYIPNNAFSHLSYPEQTTNEFSSPDPSSETLYLLLVSITFNNYQVLSTKKNLTFFFCFTFILAFCHFMESF